MANQGQARYVSDKELQRTLKCQSGKRHELRNKCLLLICFKGGTRCNEAANLKVSDIVNEDGSIRSEVVLRREVTKGSVISTLYVTNQALRKSLEDYLQYRTEQGITSQYLFPSQKGSHFNDSALSRLFLQMFEEAGLSGASSHSGRVHLCTELFNRGASVPDVQKIMRHQDPSTTFIYHRASPSRLGDLVESI